MKKVSIITVCLNNRDTIESTVNSVLSQNHPEIEYIVIDGASTDGTVNIIKKHLDRIKIFVSEKDKGIYFAINKGISISTGDIIGILNGDDFYTNRDVISRMVNAMEASGSDCVYGDLQYVGRDNPDKIIRKWVAGEYNEELFKKGWMPPHPTFFLKRQCYADYGIYNTDLKMAADYELMLRMLFKNKLKAYYLPDTLVRMRTGGVSNKSLRNRIKGNMEDRKAWKINGISPSPFTLFIKPLSKLKQYVK